MNEDEELTNPEELEPDPDPEPEDPSQLENEELDEYGNPAGTEYDENGYIIDPETPADPEPDTAPVARTPRFNIPVADFSPEERSTLTEVLGEEGLNAVNAIIERKMAQMSMSHLGANAALAQFSAENPALYGTHGSEIAAVLAKSKGVAISRKTIDQALMVIAVDEAEQTGENPGQVFMRMMNLSTQRPANSPSKKPGLRPTQKPAAPNVVSRGIAPRSNRESGVRNLMKEYDLTFAEAEDMYRDPAISGKGNRS